MNAFKAVVKKELQGYFYSPVAYVFIVVFLLASMGTTFFLANFFQADQASLESFFVFHPWLYLFFMPAIGMRLWSEEKSLGTIELLFTLPVNIPVLIAAKFIAGWIFVGITLLLTFPLVITVGYLGSPDYGMILSSYLGSFFMAGAFLAISCAASASTRNQVISFVVSVIICFILNLLGWGVFANILNKLFPAVVADAISRFSFSAHFIPLTKGIIDSRDLFYFITVILGALTINLSILLGSKKN